jgi:hypothetical protein
VRKHLISFFKFSKDEYWTEYYNGNSYRYGKYNNGLKDSIWVDIRGRTDLMSKLFFRKGVLQKTERIDLAQTGDKRIADLMVRKWDIQTFSYSNTQQFIPGKESEHTTRYISFKKEGTCIFLFMNVENGSKKEGRWELIENSNKVKMTFKNEIMIASIDYISEYSLTLTFE